MKQSIIICPMHEENLEQIAQIEQQCFSTPWSKKNFEETLAYTSYKFLVAKSGEEVVGYIGLLMTGTEADITNVAVASSEQKKGIGSKLVSAVLEEAKALGVDTIFLEVRESNEKAMKLYKKFNFLPISVRKNYYQNPLEDAIIMSVDLSTRKIK